MSDDISEFLRRAAEKRAAQQGPQPQRPQQQPPQQRRRATPMPPRPEPEVQILGPADVEIIEAEPVEHEGPAEYAARYLDTSDITRHAAALGEDLEQSEERLESHLHQRFDHQVGHLGAPEAPAQGAPAPYALQATEVSAVASEIAAMLVDPASLRNAIVLSEVLDRPEHRW